MTGFHSTVNDVNTGMHMIGQFPSMIILQERLCRIRTFLRVIETNHYRVNTICISLAVGPPTMDTLHRRRRLYELC